MISRSKLLRRAYTYTAGKLERFNGSARELFAKYRVFYARDRRQITIFQRWKGVKFPFITETEASLIQSSAQAFVYVFYEKSLFLENF